MKKTAVAVLLFLLLLLPEWACAERSRTLEAALSMLEEGNPFLVRYNAVNGTNVEARYPLGCPYFWGGRIVKSILKPFSPTQESDYYKPDCTYLYGLDCVGFTRWVEERTGIAPHDSISRLLNHTLYPDIGLYKAQKTTGEERARALRTGDLLAMRHTSGGFHIAMVAGTLRDFGYDEDSVPEALVPYLSYPLLIHCKGSGDYYERYKAWLEETGQEGILPPFGGVIVSILDAPADAADAVTPAGAEEPLPCFTLEGYHLQVTDLSEERLYRFVRWRKKPEQQETKGG